MHKHVKTNQIHVNDKNDNKKSQQQQSTEFWNIFTCMQMPVLKLHHCNELQSMKRYTCMWLSYFLCWCMNWCTHKVDCLRDNAPCAIDIEYSHGIENDRNEYSRCKVQSICNAASTFSSRPYDLQVNNFLLLLFSTWLNGS